MLSLAEATRLCDAVCESTRQRSALFTSGGFLLAGKDGVDDDDNTDIDDDEDDEEEVEEE